MNGSKKQIDNWFESFFNSAEGFKNKAPKVIICVPSIFIDYATKVTKRYGKKSKNFQIHIGGEDCHYEDKGAFTGNTSPTFLREFECKYAIVGHSERRKNQKETSELVSKKAKKVQESELTPIICIGESFEVRESKNHLEFIKEQLLKSTKEVDISKSIIAYEPVWAIGTGKVPSENDISEMADYIKSTLSQIRNTARENIKVLYGGSVKPSNAKSILQLKEVDGVLVGGASLRGDEFFKIAVSWI